MGSAAPILTVRDRRGHSAGAWHDAARAFNGGRAFHSGRGFYGRGNVYPCYDQYYVEPSYDSVVWNSDLDERVCADDCVTY